MRIDDILSTWDGESVTIQFDVQSKAWFIIAIHSTRLGTALGGTRMKKYPSFSAAIIDATNLAESMTIKLAIANLPRGGGKGVIALPTRFDKNERDNLLRRYGKLVKQLGGLYQAGSDVGTTSADMDIVAETGTPYIVSKTPKKGGTGKAGWATALGVYSGLLAISDHLFGEESLTDKRIVIQGAGSVGEPLIDMLLTAGAEIIFSDENQEVVTAIQDKYSIKYVPPKEVYGTSCDIFSPCALGGIINMTSIQTLQCLAIAGSANNQLSESKIADLLHRRNILYAPDYVINIGGAMMVLGMEQLGWSLSETEKRIRSVKYTLSEIFSISASTNISTHKVAQRLAYERLGNKYKG